MSKKRRFGQALAFTQVPPDLSDLPPRFYAAFLSGGGVVPTAQYAAALRQNGYEVKEIDLLPSERVWLFKQNPEHVWDQAFLARCPTTSYDVGNRRMCGFPEVDEVPAAQGEGVATGQDYAAIAQWTDPGKLKIRYFMPKPGMPDPKTEDVERAVKIYGRITRRMMYMQPVVEAFGDQMPYSVNGAFLASIQTTVEFAQPVEEWRKTRRQGQANRVGALPFVIAPAMVYMALAVAFVAVAGAAGWVLLRGLRKLREVDLAGVNAEIAMDQWLLEKRLDPNITPGAAAAIDNFIAARNKRRQTEAQGDESTADAIASAVTAVTVIAVIGAAVWFGGPILKEAGAAVGQKIRSFSQSRKAIAQAR